MLTSLAAMPADPAQFLRVATQGACIASHEDLWRWLGGEVQAFLPHEVMVAAWGDFRVGELQFDVVSTLPGLRSARAGELALAPLAHGLRDCWVAAQRAPCRVDLRAAAGLGDAAGESASPPSSALGWMRTALVHGTCDASVPGERIFALLSSRPRAAEGETLVLRLLMPFIDTALRRLPPLAPARLARSHRASSLNLLASGAGCLSERERQIMTWVALGKTNPEIGCILRISEFTVKNHMKSIFNKLDVTNRAQAAAKLTRLTAHA